MAKGFWTPQRTAWLMAMWEDDVPTGAIAKRLGTSNSAICGKADRLGLACRKPQTKRTGRADRPTPSIRRFSFQEAS
ncbi:MAG: GcrA family cell cycle regulator [Pseudomonadota bacterium]